jgi:hypothetical protein
MSAKQQRVIDNLIGNYGHLLSDIDKAERAHDDRKQAEAISNMWKTMISTPEGRASVRDIINLGKICPNGRCSQLLQSASVATPAADEENFETSW